MFFREVIGQQEIKDKLIKSVREDRISHALLFTGPEGTGKLPLALAFAQYISCQNRKENESCGTCPSCHKYQKLAHPDLHFVFPVYGTGKAKKPISDDFIQEWRNFLNQSFYFTLNQWLTFIQVENAQGMIYERESESIIRKLNLKSFESEYKIMIVWLPERMHPSCANKLLKMIEEPPNKTLFLLVTENEENIINTIRSRAQIIKVPKINNDSLLKYLENNGNLNKQKIEEIIHLANGNFLKVLEFQNPNEDNQYNFLKFQELMRFAYKPDIPELIQWSEDLARIGREKQKGFFIYALKIIREYFILNLKQEELTYLDHQEKEWGQKFSPFVNERNIKQISSEFELAYKHISMNGNPRIIFMDIALKTVKLIRK